MFEFHLDNLVLIVYGKLFYLLFPQYYPCIEIGIKQNRNVNADCRVHGLYITGFRPNPMYTEILAVSYIFLYNFHVSVIYSHKNIRMLIEYSVLEYEFYSRRLDG